MIKYFVIPLLTTLLAVEILDEVVQASEARDHTAVEASITFTDDYFQEIEIDEENGKVETEEIKEIKKEKTFLSTPNKAAKKYISLNSTKVENKVKLPQTGDTEDIIPIVLGGFLLIISRVKFQRIK